MTPRAGKAAAVLAAVAVALTTAGCGPLNFQTDDSLHITSPAPMSTVTSPVTVRWTSHRAQQSSYAVFVDIHPMLPGEDLREFATRQCKDVPSCEPEPSYLQGLGIYLTQQPEVEVQLGAVGGIEGRRRHPARVVTVVRMRGTKRAGDGAWQVVFRG